MNIRIADRLLQDIKQTIASRQALPFKMTLAAIADYYGVSLTPVREAVDILIAECWLEKKANGRLVIDKSRNAVNPVSVSSKKLMPTENEGIELMLTNQIMQKCLSGHDDYLREEATAKQFQVGRTVIRQVFAKIAGAGLLLHVPRCGWKVRAFSEKDMMDYLETREILEVKALQLARPHLRKTELQQLLAANGEDQTDNSVELDNQLHHYWIDRCDNGYIQDFFARHGAFYNALFDYAALGASIKQAMAAEHRDILVALIAEDWRQAENALVRHIRDQQGNVKQVMLQKGA